MKYLSVCSGIEAASVAWKPLGWEASGFSEIDAFASAVLRHHYPDVPNLGDFTGIRNRWLRRIGIEPSAVSILVGGTPCQSFSVAGLRGGLGDARGNLALGFLQLARRLRAKWVVFENVPGLLSSTSHDAPDSRRPPQPLDMECDGQEVEIEDEYDSEELHAFNCFLAGLSELGYGYAYRVLDAQFFGVAQRRNRVFVVGYLGDWRRAAAVLLERSGLRGHPAPCRETGAGTTHGVAASIRSSGAGTSRVGDTRGQDNIIASTLTGNGDAHSGYRDDAGLVTHALSADGFDASEDGTGRGTPIIPINMQVANRHQSLGERTGLGIGNPGDPAFTLQREHHHAIFQESQSGCREYELAGCVRANGPGHDPIGSRLRTEAGVRRLTPREAERLMGFPDNYTLVPYRGKPAADGPRYRALGNSIVTTVLAWIGRRIEMVEAIA